MKALVVGGTGPTGPFIVDGLLKRGYEVTIFHRGTHEATFSQEVEHLHGDPHFPETIERALRGRTFDLAVVTYGRLRHIASAMKKRTERFISVGGAGGYRASAVGDTETAPVPIREDSPLQTNPYAGKLSYLIALSETAVM
ncbi:NAD(P)H-binding protein [Chloroflexota bacterium]